jgi:hypothetical protein
LLELPGTLNVTSALRPLAEISEAPPLLSGERTSAAACGRQRGHHLLGRLPQLRVGGEGGAAHAGLDQHALRGRERDVQPVQRLLGPAGLARVVRLHVCGRDHVRAHEHGDDKEEPAEHRRLAVPRAPAGDPLHDRRPGPGHRGLRRMRMHEDLIR